MNTSKQVGNWNGSLFPPLLRLMMRLDHFCVQDVVRVSVGVNNQLQIILLLKHRNIISYLPLLKISHLQHALQCGVLAAVHDRFWLVPWSCNGLIRNVHSTILPSGSHLSRRQSLPARAPRWSGARPRGRGSPPPSSGRPGPGTVGYWLWDQTCKLLSVRQCDNEHRRLLTSTSIWWPGPTSSWPSTISA